MLVTDRVATEGRDLVDVVHQAVGGGVGLVQVREKDLDAAALRELLLRLAERLDPCRVRLLVNGHPAVARELGLGLHLPAAAPAPDRGATLLHGRSVHDQAEARRAVAEGATYVVVGPVFPTTSKPGHPGTGFGPLTQIVEFVAPMPVFAIGGLTPATVGPVLAAGAHGVAIRSAILSAPDPARAARAFARALATESVRG
jgi:thiamine-phosphate diphosphorylase